MAVRARLGPDSKMLDFHRAALPAHDRSPTISHDLRDAQFMNARAKNACAVTRRVFILRDLRQAGEVQIGRIRSVVTGDTLSLTYSTSTEHIKLTGHRSKIAGEFDRVLCV